MVANQISHKEEFIQQVRYWLPPRASQKEEWLQELEQDLKAAYKDISLEFPMNDRWNRVFNEFGTPQKVAADLLSSQSDLFIRASYKRRTIAYLVDLLISVSLFLFFVIVAGLSAYLIIVHGPDLINDYGVPKLFLLLLFLVLVNFFIASAFVALFGYYVIFEKQWGATIGKRLLRMQVISEIGLRITWQQALVRNLSKFNLQFLFFDWLIGLIMKTDHQRGLDVVSKTQVIYEF